MIREGDPESNIAHYCLHKLHKWPHEFLQLPRTERAFVIGSIEVKLEDDQKARKEAQRNARP